MGLLDRLLGRPDRSRRMPYGTSGSAPSASYRSTPYPPQPSAPSGSPGQGPDADEQAIARYRYLLRTAPPETLEQAHAEAFAQLTPEQRRQVLTGLANEVPAAERAMADDPRSLARMATRAELRQPGTLERIFGARPGYAPGVGSGMGGMGLGGMGLGGMIAGTLLASIAGTVIGSAIAEAFFDDHGDVDQGYADPDAAGFGDDFGNGYGDSPAGGYGNEFGGGFAGEFGSGGGDEF